MRLRKKVKRRPPQRPLSCPDRPGAANWRKRKEVFRPASVSYLDRMPSFLRILLVATETLPSRKALTSVHSRLAGVIAAASGNGAGALGGPILEAGDRPANRDIAAQRRRSLRVGGF